MSFAKAREHTLKIEGKYVNDPFDSGGETNWGITARIARAAGFKGRMKDMTRDEAISIYYTMFWMQPGFQAIDVIAEPVALELFDTGVNLGPSKASMMLQRCLNLLNVGGTLFSDIEVDGHVGRVTSAALAEYLHCFPTDGVEVLVAAMNSLQGAYYAELAESRPKDERFFRGWIKQRVLQ